MPSTAEGSNTCGNNCDPVKPFPLCASFESPNSPERSAKGGSPSHFADEEADTEKE